MSLLSVGDRWSGAVVCVVALVSATVARCEEPNTSLVDALAQHTAELDKIENYHIRVEDYFTEGDLGEGALFHMKTTEVWQSGNNRKWVDRVLRSESQEGMTSHGEHGDVFEFSIGSRFTRKMSGWDHAHPQFPVPLEFGRNVVELHTAACEIVPTDPLIMDELISRDRLAMRWDLMPGWSLDRSSRVCEFMEVATGDPNLVRFQIARTTEPTVFNGKLIGVGSIIDLDLRHGAAISRIESDSDGSPVVYESLGFEESASGIWWSKGWRCTYKDNVLSEHLVTACEINVPFDDETLTVQFPEGARVDDVDGRIHLWGKDAPAATFTNVEDYLSE